MVPLLKMFATVTPRLPPKYMSGFVGWDSTFARLPADSGRWRPLLVGEAAERARSVAVEIADAIEQLPPSQEQAFKGEASTALLLAHCGRPAASFRLDIALRNIVAQPSTISLFGGISGVSWLIDRLAGGEATDAVLEQFERALLQHLDVPRWQERHDLMSGLAGVGLYAAERRRGYAAEIANHVLAHLEATAIVSDAGVTWRTPPQFLAEGRRAVFPAGVVDLGVAHGVPGIVGMLVRFVEADFEGERSRRLLRSAISWLRRAIPSGAPRFGTNWPTDYQKLKRIGWCYGDAGVAGVLLRASQVLQSPELEAYAVGLLERIIPIVAAPDVPDASICHGAAGLAMIYNVAFQHTGRLQMRVQAEHWLAEVLRRKRAGTGIGGYKSLKIDGAKPRSANDTTLLSGAVGTALVLLAAVEDQRPEWLPLFLL